MYYETSRCVDLSIVHDVTTQMSTVNTA